MIIHQGSLKRSLAQLKQTGLRRLVCPLVFRLPPYALSVGGWVAGFFTLLPLVQQ